MCGGSFLNPLNQGAPSIPPPPPIEPIVRRKQPKLVDEGVRKAREDQDNRAGLAAQRGGTLVTGAGGLSTTASTQKKTLLGQ